MAVSAPCGKLRASWGFQQTGSKTDGQPLDEAGLIAFLRERLARYKVPKSVVFVDALPKTGAGKIDKKALVERYGQE